MTATLIIGGTTYPFVEDSFDLTPTIDERQRFQCDILDYTGLVHFTKGESVLVTDPVLGTRFDGVINTVKEVQQYPANIILHSIDCIDRGQWVAGKRTYTRTYVDSSLAGKIVVDHLHDVLSKEGVGTNYALHFDTTVDNFNAGLLGNVVGTSNVDNGEDQLQLAPSGVDFTYTESTTADFNTGTLVNCIAANNTLAPMPTNAIKMVAIMSLAGNVSNTETTVEIWTGSQSCIGSNHLAYQMFIDPASPEAKFGVDLYFSDGTKYSTIAATSIQPDIQGLFASNTVDTTGLSTTGWYWRDFNLDVNKTISSVVISCGGSKPGTYTAWIKNIFLATAETNPINNVPYTVITTFFGSSLNVNPPQQLQSYGFSNTDVTVDSTYDLYNAISAPLFNATAYKTTNSISVSSVNILRSSYISWVSLQPSLCAATIAYSLDGGNSFTNCTNNAPLPNLPAGTNLTGKSIQLMYGFFYLPGAPPDTLIALENISLTLNTSYQATKTDVTYEAALQADWNLGTLTNLIANTNNELTLNGIVRNWDNGSDAGQTMFSAFSGITQGIVNRSFRFGSANNTNTEAKSRLDFAGQWQNFTAEVDIKLDPADPVQHGLVYRTTGWNNNAGHCAYYVWVTSVFVAFGKGNNSSSGVATTQSIISSASITSSSGSWHRLKVVVLGNTHTVYVDNVQILSTTDSSFPNTGYIGLFFTDGGTTSATLYDNFYDNFGIVSALSGTWVSPSINLSSANTYGSSVISWRDTSMDYNGQTNVTILVEASFNGGSTYTACTNGSPLPTLVAGQSLSGVSMLIRITLSTTTASSLSAIDSLIVRVIGSIGNVIGTRSTAPMVNDTSITRTVGSGWGTAFDGQAWAQVGTGGTSVGTGEANITNTTGDVHMVCGSRTWTDEDETIRFRLSAGTIAGGLELRYTDTNNYYRLSISTTAISIIKKRTGVVTTLNTISSTQTINTWYRARFRIVGADPVYLFANVWNDTTLEPTINPVTGIWNDNNWTLVTAD